MLLDLGRRVRDDILSSDFDSIDSPWALEMAGRMAIPEARFTKGFAEMVRVAAPPVAWEVLARWLNARARKARYGEPEMEKKVLIRFKHLGRKIDKELDRLCQHPAYHDAHIMGADAVSLPFYQIGSGPMRPTPSRAIRDAPNDGPMRCGILWPTEKRTPHGTMTSWSPDFTG